MIQIANVFLMAHIKIIGLRYAHRPFLLPGFWIGFRIPRLSATGLFASAVAVFSCY